MESRGQTRGIVGQRPQPAGFVDWETGVVHEFGTGAAFHIVFLHVARPHAGEIDCCCRSCGATGTTRASGTTAAASGSLGNEQCGAEQQRKCVKEFHDSSPTLRTDAES